MHKFVPFRGFLGNRSLVVTTYKFSLYWYEIVSKKVAKIAQRFNIFKKLKNVEVEKCCKRLKITQKAKNVEKSNKICRILKKTNAKCWTSQNIFQKSKNIKNLGNCCRRLKNLEKVETCLKSRNIFQNIEKVEISTNSYVP